MQEENRVYEATEDAELPTQNGGLFFILGTPNAAAKKT